MTMPDLALLGSLVSAVAVLVSLVFLGLQARYMIRNQQSVVHLGRTQLMNDFYAVLASPEMTEIVLRGNRGDAGLTIGEHFRYGNVVWISLMLAQNDFLQHRAGLMSDEQFDANLGLLMWQRHMPGVRAWWAQSRAGFEKHFVAYVDGLLAQVPADSDAGVASYQAWKEEAARQVASAAPNYRNTAAKDSS
jgi:hypothetical protein